MSANKSYFKRVLAFLYIPFKVTLLKLNTKRLFCCDLDLQRQLFSTRRQSCLYPLTYICQLQIVLA